MTMLTDLEAAVRGSGLPVVPEPGWAGRGHGPMSGAPRAVVLHHTAGPRSGDAPSLGVVVNGRPDLAGPLAHLVLARSGTVHIVAAGLCWHAGATWTINQSNAYAIGIEAEATGVDPWPPAQYQAYLRLVRALCDHYRIPVAAVQGHKEVCSPRGRKSDPNFDCEAFRRGLGGITPGRPVTPSSPGAPNASAPTRKVQPVIIERPLSAGDQYLRIPAMVGSASGLYGRAWVSVSAQHGASGTVLFQRDTDRNDVPPTGAGAPWRVNAANGSREWVQIPSGTEYLECQLHSGGVGFVAVEFEPKA